MDKTTEAQYHHSINILLEKYRLGFISVDELQQCLHWILEDLFDYLRKE